MDFETTFFIASLLLFVSVIMSKMLGGYGIPSLVVFLALGMLAGSEGIGGIYFDNALLSQSLGTVALIYILFSGGLDTNIKRIRPIMKTGLVLASFGVIMTTLITGVFVHWLLKWGWVESFLLGSIISSTDAAAVFAALRTKHGQLKGNLAPLLEFESGSNDPMAVMLTVLCLQLLESSEFSGLAMAIKVVTQFIMAGVVGFFAARLMGLLFNRIKLEYEGLYPVLSLALVMLLYLLSDNVGANGFLAVYVCGIFLSDQAFVSKRSTMIFHDGVAWLMQITMFITLGLLVFPSRLPPVIGEGLLISAFLIIVARPATIFVFMYFSKFNFKEKLLISWVGLRGSVPIILATFPFVAKAQKADYIFNLVFFIVITSVLLQGSTIKPVARWLGLLEVPQKNPEPLPPTHMAPTTDINAFANILSFPIPPNSPWIGKHVVDLNLPEGILIIFINRNGKKFIPRGSTMLESDDDLMIVTNTKEEEQMLLQKINPEPTLV